MFSFLGGADKLRNHRRDRNLAFLEEPGLNHLRAMLASRHYRLTAPENGALLVVVWLLDQGRAEEMEAVLNAISPYFERIDYYPAPGEEQQFTERVSLMSVKRLRKLLIRASRREQHDDTREQAWELVEFLRGPESRLPEGQASARRRWEDLIERGGYLGKSGHRLRQLLWERARGPLQERDLEWLSQLEPEPEIPPKPQIATALLRALGTEQFWQIPELESLPPSLQKLVDLARPGSLDELVARGVVTSGQRLGRLLPRLMCAPQSSDPAIVHLVRAMQSVSGRDFCQFPWVRPLGCAKRKVERAVKIHLQLWPDLPFSRAFVSQLRELSLQGGLSEIWAAPENLGWSARILQDSCYQRFYDLDLGVEEEVRSCGHLGAPFAAMELADRLPLAEMIRLAYTRILRRRQRRWGHVVFYFSFLRGQEQDEFLSWAPAPDVESLSFLEQLSSARAPVAGP